MKLLLAYPNTSSYSETFIRNHIKYLQPEETLTGGWKPFIDKNGKTIFRFPMSVNAVRGGIKNLVPALYSKLYTSALKRYIKKTKVEVVMAEYGITGTNMMQACKDLQIPLVPHYHGFDAYEYATIKEYAEKYRSLFSIASRIIAVSDDMKNELIRLGAAPEKVTNNPYGVELDRFKIAEPALNKNIIITVGRFTAKKAPDLTIKAFQMVQQKVHDAELWMIGDGELWDECKQLAVELNLQGSIKFLGVKTPDEIAGYLSQARIFTQHSVRPQTGDSEGTPNSVLEASAVGLPIVSTMHAGIKEAVVHNITGYLVEEGNYKQAAVYITELLSDAGKIASFGKAARLHMEKNYRISDRIEHLQRLLKQ